MAVTKKSKVAEDSGSEGPDEDEEPVDKRVDEVRYRVGLRKSAKINGIRRIKKIKKLKRSNKKKKVFQRAKIKK